ncbi:MAG: septum formation initiator family protein [Phreatobacter sp.]|uniref:FtsB family cell division protein n=1 Tax=Phreatobacter sp. TaxID=1966341 RepID=UPI0027326BDE|nr:septum formation initiator family protein [Phreatobacter sp.]MDP2803907.1 septum formation initiator family protein [Phreatobacter sp.]
MVVRTRRQRILQAMGLYAAAAALIAYFGFHAYHGERGIHAKQQLIVQIDDLGGQLATLRKERADVARRVSLLRAEAIDPDMLDERAREILNFVDPRDLVLIMGRR